MSDGVDTRVVRGWKDIAKVIDVSVRSAQERADPDGRFARDPLPIRVSHRGPWAYVSALRDWVFRYDNAYQTALRLQRAERRHARTSPEGKEHGRPGSAAA